MTSNSRKSKSPSRKQQTKTAKSGSARAAAIDILLGWQAERTPVDGLFNRLTALLPSRDRGFAKTIVYGVLRQKQYLDFIIEQFSKHPLKKMKPRTLITLETGVYQLLFLDRIPPSAAVHATVETLKDAGQPRWLQGFANGILRNVIRKKDTLPPPEEAKTKGHPILNHPGWMIDRWQHQFGRKKTEDICRLNNTEPLLTLRVNTRIMSRDKLLTVFVQQKIEAINCTHSNIGIHLPSYTGLVTDLPGFEQGAFQIQDESAQLATLLLGSLHEKKRILDGCAGLGGKTSHLAQLSTGKGEIIAVEPDPRRSHLLRENLTRLQLNQQITIIPSNLEAFAATRPQGFDAILLDVPCSGTGVIRRHPDIRWNRSPADIQKLQNDQLQLLTIGASLLNPGGILVYATCSIEPEEDEGTIARFLAATPNYSILDACTFLPETAHCFVDEQGLFNPLPAPTHDGFFAAALQHSPPL